MNDKPIITACILAGGEGRRVGRQNKGLLPFKNKPLIQHVINHIQSSVTSILISANHQIEQYRTLGFPVYPDLAEWKNKGPLAGVLSLYPHIPSNSEYLLIVPCDTPFLPEDLVPSLTKALKTRPDLLIAYAATPTMIHPSIFLCKPYTNDYLANHLNQNHYSLKSWILSHPNIKVQFTDEHAFTNINDLNTLTHNQ